MVWMCRTMCWLQSAKVAEWTTSPQTAGENTYFFQSLPTLIISNNKWDQYGKNLHIPISEEKCEYSLAEESLNVGIRETCLQFYYFVASAVK